MDVGRGRVVLTVTPAVAFAGVAGREGNVVMREAGLVGVAAAGEGEREAPACLVGKLSMLIAAAS